MRMKPKIESPRYTIWEDLDGKTIEQVAAWLLTFPPGAVIDARTTWREMTTIEEDYFVITWEDQWNGVL